MCARYSVAAVLNKHGTCSRFIADGLTLEERPRKQPVSAKNESLGLVLSEGRTLRLNNLIQDPGEVGLPPGLPPLKTLLAVPIAGHAQVFGTLYVAEKEGDQPFTVEDEECLAMLAEDAALALENARLFREMNARLAELQAVFEVSESLARALSLDETLQLVVDRARARMPLAGGAVIHLIDQSQGLLVPRAVSGSVAIRRQNSGFKLGQGIAGRAADERRLVYVPDVRAEPGFVDTGTTLRSLVVVPLVVSREVVGHLSIAGDRDQPDASPRNRPNSPVATEDSDGEVLGVFSVSSSQPDAFDEDNLRLLASLGHQAAVAVKKAQITDSLRESLAALQQRSAELETSLTRLQETHVQLIQAAKLASLGTLSAGIAHEINNPLGFIRSNLNTMAGYVSQLRTVIDLNTQLRQKPSRPEIKVPLPLLKPGMILSRDLYSAKGLLLMASDTPLRPSHIERIRNFNNLEPIGPIYVYRVETPS